MKEIYLLREYNSWENGDSIAAVCLTKKRAIEMLKEWYDEEVEDKGSHEEIDSKIEIDEDVVENSYAEIRSKSSNAFECMEIKYDVADEWLN